MQDSFYYVVEYACFFALLFLAKHRKGLRLFDDSGFVANFSMLVLVHLGGILLFAVFPYFFHQSSFSFSFKPTNNLAILVTWLIAGILVILSRAIAKRKFIKARTTYNCWLSPAQLVVYFLVRILFIAAYETWFRGFLLTGTIATLGVVPAVLGNIALYAMLHLVNGRQEVLVCVPFGFLLCSVCIWVGAVWPAILLHLAFTIPFEIRFLKNINTAKALRIEDINHRSVGISR
ncbi:MAG TPA: CPBP family intramembrane glutamic endopeptidase [Flavitalea sp.]|nr:CPBP family intramembrane glutamic endopeptidase [Flavitalea sp.]